MKVRVPSNGNITPMARKSSARIFHSAIRSRALAEGNASAQIPPTGECSPPENYEFFPWFGESGLRVGPRAAHARGACLLID